MHQRNSQKKSLKNIKWGERVRDQNAMKLISLDDVKVMIQKILENQLFWIRVIIDDVD